MNIRPDFNLIERIADELHAMLGEEDAQAFWDSLDGETDVMDIIGKLIVAREERKATAAACKAVADEYTARARRMAEGEKSIAKVLGTILDATGERKVAHPFGTVSRTKGRLSLAITDESAVPSQLTVTRVSPDAAAIKAQLEAGESVPGAELVRGDDGITIRVK